MFKKLDELKELREIKNMFEESKRDMSMVEFMLPSIVGVALDEDGLTLKEIMDKIIRQDDKKVMKDIKRETGQDVDINQLQYFKAISKLHAIEIIAKNSIFSTEARRNELADYMQTIVDDIRKVKGDLDEFRCY